MEIFNSGMEKVKLYKSLFVVSKYQADKNEKTFNASIIFPHTNMRHYHNDIYIIKRCILGFRSIDDGEIEDIMKLIRYDKERSKKYEEKKNKAVRTVDKANLQTNNG